METLVAGAGVAGLSAGIALSEAGHRVTIVERAHELRQVGAALSIWPNALAALDTLGLGDVVRAIGIEAHTDDIRAPSGRSIVRLQAASVARALGETPVVVLRAGLQKALRQRAEQLGIEIRLRRRVGRLRATPSKVEVYGAGAYDAVVGADGINSEVRGAVVTRGALRDCHRLALRALIPNDGSVTGAWLTIGVGVQVIAAPAPEGQVYWAVDAPDAPGQPAEILRRYFADWHDPIPRLIEQTPDEVWLIDRLHDWPRPDTLHRGRLLLVGDAGHPMTPDLGQGACQAIEDAAILLATARAHPGAPLPELFARVARTRLPRVRMMVRDSYLAGRVALVGSRLGARVRDAVTAATPEAVANRRLATYASADSWRRHLATV